MTARSRGSSVTNGAGIAARPITKANEAMHPVVMSEAAFTSNLLRDGAYYADDTILVLNMDVREGVALLAEAGVEVNCVVTSPPFYGQRDYEVARQIGLEPHPSEFISTLADVFDSIGSILAPNGSLWVNIGDTYWSGKGEHKSGESKQSARRFGVRPQDKKGDGKWCVPKQLLLIPQCLTRNYVEWYQWVGLTACPVADSAGFAKNLRS